MHEHVGMMLQDSFIFNSTVNENLKYPKKDVTDEECRDACRKLGIHDLIMDRAGQYDAATGDRGR